MANTDVILKTTVYEFSEGQPYKLEAKPADPLTQMVMGTASVSGESYYQAFAQNLAQALDVRYVIVAEVVNYEQDRPTRVRSLAFWNADNLDEPIEYDLPSTPCEKLFTEETINLDGAVACFPKDLNVLFPSALGKGCFLGVTLLAKKTNRPLGHICLMDDKPLQNREQATAIMTLFASRTAVELERQQAEAQERERTRQLELALHQLKQTQGQLVHTEKISSLGQLVAGVAHEVNNPVTFISGNLDHATNYIQDLFAHLQQYQATYPEATPKLKDHAEEIDLEFLAEDLPKLLTSMQVGIDRVRDIMQSLRDFSRVDANKTPVDVHQGLESTLMILQHRLKAKSERPAIIITKDYGELPLVSCCLGQLNQVFMNLLANAIDAMEEDNAGRSYAELEKHPNQIKIITRQLDEQKIEIRIVDNGLGIPEDVQAHLFEAFFTTKPFGKGTGLGLSISHQVITEIHGGTITCNSQVGQGAEFIIRLPFEH